MASYATCKFPLVDEWKNAGDKNEVIATIDSVFSGYAQIVLSDNSFTGLLFIIATFLVAVPMGVTTLVCSTTAVLFAKLMRVPDIMLRLGLYSFSPALAGFGVWVLIFPGQGVSAAMIAIAMICGILCVIITAAMSAFFGKWGISGFSLPFVIVLAFLLPATLNFTNLPVIGAIRPYMNGLADAAVAGSGSWTAAEFVQAVLNGFAEAIFQADTISAILVLAGILISSRIDVGSGIVAVTCATAFAILLGLPKGNIMAGLYGFNALFIMLSLFGRGFAMSVRSFIYALISAVLSVVLYAGLGGLFAPLGIPVGAFPFAIIAISSMMGRDFLTGMRFVELIYWGVPETIAKMLKSKDAEEAKEATAE